MTPLSKPLLQRRSNILATIQSLLDVILVIGLTYGLAIFKFGRLPTLYFIFCIVLVAIMSISYDRFGIYRNNGNFIQKSIIILKAWTITFAILLAIAFLTKTSALFSRQLLITFYISGALGQIALHMISRFILIKIKVRQDESTALLIGTGRLATFLYDKVNNNPWISEKIIGAVRFDNDALISNERRITDADKEPPALGCLDDVIPLVVKHNIKVVYITVPLNGSPEIKKLYAELLDKNVDVHWAPNIFSLNLINHSVKELAGIPIITLSETPLIGKNLAIKVLQDRIIAFLILILISPVLVLISLAIKLDSPGPVFFRQERTGWDGKVFKIWKFRTMKVHQQGSGFLKQATRDDPRVTKIGKYLRRSSIDELPQIFNVLEGSMSLVGPRPHAVGHNIEYAKHIDVYLARHRIKPGITGLAQVRGYRGATEDIALMVKRVDSDLEYINDWSISLDMVILIRTFLFIFKKHDAY